MQLSTKQARIFRLAQLLGNTQPVSATRIITELGCSEPTLTRALKEIRETYSAEIKYSKATHSYQLTGQGTLDKKVLRQMSQALQSSDDHKSSETVSHVSLGLAAPDSDRHAAERIAEKFPTSGIAVLHVSGPWAELELGGAQLVEFHIPR